MPVNSNDQNGETMRRLIATEFVSLDRVFEEPQKWTFQFFDEGVRKYKYDETFASDARLLGRVTYEGFAAAWPSMKDEQGFADRFNSMPKYVVSKTLDRADWNNSHVIGGNVREEVSRLKEEPGQDIVIHGSGELVNSLMQEDLIDEYRLMVFPVVLGGGKRLFRDGGSKKTMRLVDTKTFDSGVMVLTYGPGETTAS
jgi:dihydrofolate reductase